MVNISGYRNRWQMRNFIENLSEVTTITDPIVAIEAFQHAF